MFVAMNNPNETRPDQIKPHQNRHGMILLIDPEPSSASITASNLTFWGYTVDIVHSFSQALELLKMGELVPDLIFVDILNPVHLKRALRFPVEVKKVPRWANIPIIARSAIKDKATILKLFKAGYADYVVAPLEKDVLKDRVDKALRKSLIINPLTFPKPISAPATVVTEIQLTSINEFGLEAYSNAPLANQTVFTLESELLDSLDLDQILVKVVTCQNSDYGDWLYKLTLTFVGLSPAMRQRIRQFAIANKDRNYFARKRKISH